MESVQPRDTYWRYSEVIQNTVYAASILAITEIAYRLLGSSPSNVTRVSVFVVNSLPSNWVKVEAAALLVLIAGQEGIFPFQQESLYGLLGKSICLSAVSPGDPYKLCESSLSVPVMNSLFFFILLLGSRYCLLAIPSLRIPIGRPDRETSNEGALVAAEEDGGSIQIASDGTTRQFWDLSKSILPPSLRGVVAKAEKTKEQRHGFSDQRKWTRKELRTKDGGNYEKDYFRESSWFGCCSYSKKVTRYENGAAADDEGPKVEEADE